MLWSKVARVFPKVVKACQQPELPLYGVEQRGGVEWEEARLLGDIPFKKMLGPCPIPFLTFMS